MIQIADSKTYYNVYGIFVLQWLKEDEEFNATYKDVLSFGEPYIDRSVELCWTMQIQDPPMHLEFDSSANIDKSVFRLFTRNGNTLDFVVWPALMLHENGPLVHKGVVQPLPKKKEDFNQLKDKKTQINYVYSYKQ